METNATDLKLMRLFFYPQMTVCITFKLKFVPSVPITHSLAL